jgi:hypothetical protein
MGRESEHSLGVNALAIESESGAKSKESQIITAGDLWFTNKNGPIILSVIMAYNL